MEIDGESKSKGRTQGEGEIGEMVGSYRGETEGEGGEVVRYEGKIRMGREAAVRVDGEGVGEIETGLLVLLGVERDDDVIILLL